MKAAMNAKTENSVILLIVIIPSSMGSLLKPFIVIADIETPLLKESNPQKIIIESRRPLVCSTAINSLPMPGLWLMITNRFLLAHSSRRSTTRSGRPRL
jgi:hypothetical protein